MENTFNTQAKALFTAKQDAIKAALNSVVNAKGIVTSAAQLVAITSYQAFEVNGSSIPAAQIGALLNLSDDENKKLKQYVSRANFVWGYKGKTYSVDNVDITTPHTELMTEQAPSITTIYKEIKAHEKQVKAALEAATQARAMELKAAQAYVESGADLPQGVTNADELLAKGRASNELGLSNDFTAALDMGREIVDAENAAFVEAETVTESLAAITAQLDALYDMNSDTANDAINSIYEYIEGLADKSMQEVEAQAA